MTEHLQAKAGEDEVFKPLIWHFMDAKTVSGYAPWVRYADYEALQAHTVGLEARLAALQSQLEAADRLAEAMRRSWETHCGIAEHILKEKDALNAKGIFADSQRARLGIDAALAAYTEARKK